MVIERGPAAARVEAAGTGRSGTRRSAPPPRSGAGRRATGGARTTGGPGPRLWTGAGPERYPEFVAAVRDELTPVGPIEEALVGIAAAAAWALAGDAVPTASEGGRLLVRTLGLLDRHRARRRRPRLRVVRPDAPTDPVRERPPLGPPVHVEGLEPGDLPGSDPDRTGPAGGRLVFDPEVSAGSPVVRGTWVTAAQIVALVVQGWSWAEILRAHPELVEDDLRACLDHAVAAGLSGP